MSTDKAVEVTANSPELTEAWLETIGLAYLAPVFLENRVGLEHLSALTDDDLKEMGVTALGDRRTILKKTGVSKPPVQTAAPDADLNRHLVAKAVEDYLPSYWKCILWGLIIIPLIGPWIIVGVSSIMYYKWRKEYPVKAEQVNYHGWLAWLVGNILYLIIIFAGDLLDLISDILYMMIIYAS